MKKERRRAIHCEMLEASKTSPGYFKYQITIKEKDGSVNKVPAYGKDMQDAIERLIWNEWNNHKGMSLQVAKVKYIELINLLYVKYSS